MDATDFKILEHLQQNGRISMKKLAERINMSVPATIERVRRLEENKSILAYRAIIRPDRIGREMSAFVLAAVDISRRERLYDYIRDSDNIIEAYDLAGRFTVFIKMSCKDMEEFLKTMYDLYELGTTETYLITDLLKIGIYKRLTDTRDDGRSFYSPGKALDEEI